MKEDKNQNLDVLSTLTNEEKLKVKEILAQISDKGKSKELDNLYYDDYEEIPVDLETFLSNDLYLGNYTNHGKDIYETWKKELAYVHNPATFCDQWAITGSTGTGKASPLRSKVFTANGYIKMGDIQIGTKVINGKGYETEVTHIYPQGKLPVYRITFSDRTYIECADNHLWQVTEYGKGRAKENLVLNTLQLKENLNKGYKYRIPLAVIDCWNSDTEIDPYLLGCLIGDGCLQTDSISICTPEQDIKIKIENIVTSMGYSFNYIARDSYGIRANGKFGFNSNKGSINPLKDYLNSLGLLCKSVDKHIPKEYLYTTVENRIKLLQGLFDTDGWVCNNGKARSVLIWNTSSPQLSEDFAFLVRSLGGTDTVVRKKAKYCTKNSKDYIECNDSYQHTIKFSNDILPFSSNKHKSKYIEPQNKAIRRIINIEHIGEEECQCIVVKSNDHTYLMDNLTVTHNSTVSTYSLCYELYKLMCLKNPNRFYLDANETIWILFFNLNLKLAEKTMWGKFQKALQMSPWFMERGTVTGRTNLVYQPNKDIKLGIGSTEEHALSVAVMFCAIDEMSFGDNDNVEYMQAGMMQIYNQLYLRLSSRFSKEGRIQGRMYLISSAKSTNAVLESFIRDNEGQPGMHVSRYKQWEVLPASKFSGKWFKLAVGNELLSSYIMGTNVTDEQVKEAEEQGYQVIDVPLETLHRFEMDLNRTLIDTCGISVQSSYKYIPYRIVEPCIGNGSNPFKDEIIKTGLKDKLQIKDFFISELVPEMLYSKKLYIHCDLSKSGDMTGISAVAVLGYKNQERYDDTGQTNTLKEIVFRHVFSVGLQCPPNDELSMIKVKDFLHYLKYDLGWNIAGVSCDGYQSLMLLQSLQLDGFVVKEVSMDIIKNKECVGYTAFRNVLVEQRIKLLKLHTLLKEITNLEKNDATGKVDHPKQCLIGDTKIKMLDGKSKTILELLSDYENNIPNYVYTFNEKTLKIEPKLIKNVWFTGYRKDLYKITLDNGAVIICTSNHPFMLREGSYKSAENLQVNEALMPLYTKISNKGLKGYRMYYEPMECRWHYEHTNFDLIRQNNYTKGNVTHHANYNKLDNKPTNLKYITKQRHRYIHNRNQFLEERLKRSESIKNWHKLNKDSVLYKQRTKKTIDSLKKYNLENKTKILAVRQNIDYNNFSEEAKLRMNHKGYIKYTNGYKSILLPPDLDPPANYYRPISNTRINRGKQILRLKQSKLIHAFQKNIKYKHKKLCNLNKRLYQIGKKLDKLTYNDFNKFVYKNHKILKIEKLDKYEKVYDIEVEDNHNFALDAGIFVHNSVKILEDGTKVKSVGKDISDSLGGAIYNAILSVDVNELDYLENITIAETGIATLNSYETVADRLFGFNRDARGNLIQIDNKTDENEDELISNAINQEIKNNQKVLDQIKQSNKNTKLSDQQLLDMYNTMTGNGFVIF